MSATNLLYQPPQSNDNSGRYNDESGFMHETKIPFVGKWYNHAVGILLFAGYEIVIVKLMRMEGDFLDYICAYVLDISMFYLNSFLAIPFMAALWKGRHYFLFPLLLIVIITLQSLLQVCMSHLVKFLRSGLIDLETGFILGVRSIWRAIYVIGIGWAYWLAIHYAIKTSQKRELLIRQKDMEKRHALLQNAYLQARISPHFLFNTLNFIYTLAIENAAQTASAISELSDLMRYSLTEPESDAKVPLDNELKGIDSFIQIVKLRFGERLRLRYDVNIHPDKRSHRIPPHILMSFIENMAKHGVLTDEEMPAVISITYPDDTLVLTTKNRRNNSNDVNNMNSGIANNLARLDSHYPRLYSFKKFEDANTFEILLKIKLCI